MRIERAKQIVQSKDNIDVYLNGDPIWINLINNDGKTAQIRNIMNDNRQAIVYIADLEEGVQ